MEHFFLLSSSEALDRMKNVLMVKTKSRRHELFLDKKEWECSTSIGVRNSRLIQLINPYVVIELGLIGAKLEETVFLKFLRQADPQLKKVANILGDHMPMKYSLYVLVPETFIHKLEVIYHVFKFLSHQNDQPRQLFYVY